MGGEPLGYVAGADGVGAGADVGEVLFVAYVVVELGLVVAVGACELVGEVFEVLAYEFACFGVGVVEVVVVVVPVELGLMAAV